MQRMPAKAMPSRSAAYWLSALVVAAGIAAYAGGLCGPFIFDDLDSIPDNPNIRSLWPPWQTMSAPPQSTIVARPIVSLTLAVNYAIGGLDVRGYHLVNVGLHLAAALVLMGVVGRTLVSSVFDGRFDRSAPYLAAAAATIWAVHPLQTESVTYVIQRTEILWGLFCLLTLYCAIRGWASGRRGWTAAAVFSCALGMGSKEVMVVAPLLVLLYDRTFVSGTFRTALGRHWRLYAYLAATYAVLAAALLTSPPREAAGFGLGIGWWDYLKTQAGVIVWYLRLCFWPRPLVLSYDDWPIARSLVEVLPQAMLVAALLAGTVWAMQRRPAMGFAGAWFFLILAPTSSVYPMALEIAAERRMYLPLAAVVVLVVAGGYCVLTRCYRHAARPMRAMQAAAIVLAVAIAVPLVGLTALRNRDYRDTIRIWRDTVSKRPANAQAHCNLATALIERGRPAHEALPHLEKAIAIKPEAEAFNGLGIVLASQGRLGLAVDAFEHALRLRPNYPYAHTNLGKVLVLMGQTEEAIRHHQRAIALKGDFAEAHLNLGVALLSRGEVDEARRLMRLATELKPDLPEAHYNLGNLLAQQGQLDEAVRCFERALQFRRKFTDARNNLAAALYRLGRVDEAIAHWRRALEFKPDAEDVHTNLGGVLLTQGDVASAIRHWRRALEINPNRADARAYLEMALSQADSVPANGPAPGPVAGSP